MTVEQSPQNTIRLLYISVVLSPCDLKATPLMSDFGRLCQTFCMIEIHTHHLQISHWAHMNMRCFLLLLNVCVHIFGGILGGFKRLIMISESLICLAIKCPLSLLKDKKLHWSIPWHFSIGPSSLVKIGFPQKLAAKGHFSWGLNLWVCNLDVWNPIFTKLGGNCREGLVEATIWFWCL